MSEGISREGTGRFSGPRYVVLSLLASLFIAASFLGYMSDKPEFASLLGQYQGGMHENWFSILLLGVFFGVVNLLISLAKR